MEKLCYFIKRPNESSRNSRFSIVAYSGEGESRQYFPFYDERIDSLNLQLQNGKLESFQVEMALKNIILEKYRKSEDLDQRLRASELNNENMKLFLEYWSEVYELKENKDLTSAENDFKRALRIIGSLPLASASAKELIQALKKNSAHLSQRKKATMRINELLRHLGRNIHLPTPTGDEIDEIKYLKEDEVLTLVSHISCPILKDAVLCLYAGGFRIGELIAINPDDLSDGQVYVSKQIRTGKKATQGKKAKPKSGKVGWVAIIPKYLAAVERWSKVENKLQYRYQIYEEVTSLSKKLWPKLERAHVTPHCIRHAHAIYLAGAGATISDIARNLRNTNAVCEKYYAGFVHTEETSNRLLSLIS